MKAYAIADVVGQLGALIHSEYDSTYDTDLRVLLAGAGGQRAVPQHAVVATVGRGARTVTAAADAGNVGNGVMTLAGTPAAANAKPGPWRVVIVEAVANAGRFIVEDPDGVEAGAGVVGAAYNGPVKFTLADGATDFAAGDGFTITVAYAAVGKTVQIDFSANDGSQNADGIACFFASAADGVDDQITVLGRGPVIVRRPALVWPAGATNTQIAAATQQLQALGIQVRDAG